MIRMTDGNENLKSPILLDNAADPIFQVDNNGVIQTWNPGAREFFQMDESQALGRPAEILLEPASHPVFVENLDKTIRGRWNGGFEAGAAAKAGHISRLWIHLKQLKGIQGAGSGVMVTMRAIGPRETSENDPVPSGGLQTLLENFTEEFAFYTTDPEGTILSWSPEVAQVDGFPDTEILGKNISMFYLPQDLKNGGGPREELKKARETGTCEAEGWRIRKNGERFWARVITNPNRDKNGRLVGFTRAVRDLTETKNTRRRLERGYNQFKTLIENASDLVAVLDRRGVIAFISPSVRRLLGYSVKECLDREALGFIHPGDAPFVLRDFKRLREKEGPGERPFEFRLRHKDGHWLTFEGIGNNLLKNNFVPGIVINARDVSKIKELEDQILRATEMERGRIAGDLHDGLVQQLGGIEFLAHVLKSHLEFNNRPEASQARKIGQYISEALHKTRDLSHKLYPIGLKEGLVHALKIFSDDLSSLFNVTCLLNCEPDLVIKDREKERHCYYIIQEAVKNSLQHGQASEIVISVRRRDDKIFLSVRDNGRGLKEEGAEGNGIGTRLMMGRARLINGSLDIQSQPGGGTEVTCAVSETAEKIDRRRKGEPS